MLKNSKIVLFLSPQKVGRAGNFWTLLRISAEPLINILHEQLALKNWTINKLKT